jgi:hypothetical protein
VLRDAFFVFSLAVVFGLQLYYAERLIARSGDTGAADGVAVLVIVCFLIGIARTWELVGGPTIGLRSELSEMRHARHTEEEP